MLLMDRDILAELAGIYSVKKEDKNFKIADKTAVPLTILRILSLAGLFFRDCFIFSVAFFVFDYFCYLKRAEKRIKRDLSLLLELSEKGSLNEFKTYESLKELCVDDNGNKEIEIKKALVKKVIPESFEKVLDIGCKSGSLSKVFRAKMTVGVDVSRKFLKAFRKNVSQNIVLADAEHLPFKKGSFDFVSMTDVIEHLSNPSSAVSEANEVLSKRGKLLLITDNLTYFDHNYLNPLVLISGVMLEKQTRYADTWQNYSFFHNLFSKKEIKKIVIKPGLTSKYLYSFNYLPWIFGDNRISFNLPFVGSLGKKWFFIGEKG